MAKQPLFDVSRFNDVADYHNVPWVDRIPLIESICWGSKGWINPDLQARINGEYRQFMADIEIERANPQPVIRGSKVGIKTRQSENSLVCAACCG